MSYRTAAPTAVCFAFASCWMLYSFAQEADLEQRPALKLSTPQTTSGAATDELQDLLQERSAVLTQRAETIRARVRDGSQVMEEVFRAENDALLASLDLAEGQKERVAIRMQVLENARKIEQTYQLYQRNGIGPVQDYLLAKSDRIAAEIAVLRERVKMNPMDSKDNAE